MLNVSISGLEGLKKLLQKAERYQQEVDNLNGQTIDTRYIDFYSGPVLHQGNDNMSEQESAQFELDNPEIVAYLQSLKEKLNRILQSSM